MSKFPGCPFDKCVTAFDCIRSGICRNRAEPNVRFVYPQIVEWENVIPSDYPFIHVKGEGMGVLLVFATMDDYNKFSDGDGKQPILIREGEKSDGEQNRRNRKGKS